MPKKSNKRRKDGLIRVQVYLGRVEGKPKYKDVYGHTQKEADEKADELRAMLKKGLSIESRDDTFGEWAARWHKFKTSERISKGRINVYKHHIAHLNRRFEHVAISKIRSADIQELFIDLAQNNPNTNKPMAEKTLSDLRVTAMQIFQFAIDNRLFEYNPASSVKIPSSATKREARALTEIEQTWITDTPHRAQRAAMIMMYAGLRRGELIPLTWNDIDFNDCTITVNKAVEVDKGGKFVLKTLDTSKELVKSEASYRIIDIPQKLVDFLKNEKRESIYVCVSVSGKMHTESSWRRMWDSYLADLNLKYGDFSPFEKQYSNKFDPGGIPFVIPRINPHWLRHTFCTLLYFAGYDLKSTMEQMGHADIKTTLSIYTHLDKKHKRNQVRKLDDYLNTGNIQVTNAELSHNIKANV